MDSIDPGLIRSYAPRDTRGARNARLLILSLGLAAAVSFAPGRLLHDKPWTPPALKTADFLSGIPVAKDQLRLVVSVLELHKSALAESEKRVLGVDLGTTRVALSMPARVHYAVDLSGERPIEFRVDQQRRELVAVFADPKVQAVELLAAGKRVAVEPGWGRLRALSGQALEERLERGLYDAVKADAAAPAAIEQIKERARPLLARLLNDYLRRAGAFGPDGIAFTSIRFRGDADADRLALLSPASPALQ